MFLKQQNHVNNSIGCFYLLCGNRQKSPVFSINIYAKWDSSAVRCVLLCLVPYGICGPGLADGSVALWCLEMDTGQQRVTCSSTGSKPTTGPVLPAALGSH